MRSVLSPSASERISRWSATHLRHRSRPGPTWTSLPASRPTAARRHRHRPGPAAVRREPPVPYARTPTGKPRSPWPRASGAAVPTLAVPTRPRPYVIGDHTRHHAPPATAWTWFRQAGDQHRRPRVPHRRRPGHLSVRTTGSVLHIPKPHIRYRSTLERIAHKTRRANSAGHSAITHRLCALSPAGAFHTPFSRTNAQPWRPSGLPDSQVRATADATGSATVVATTHSRRTEAIPLHAHPPDDRLPPPTPSLPPPNGRTRSTTVLADFDTIPTAQHLATVVAQRRHHRSTGHKQAPTHQALRRA